MKLLRIALITAMCLGVNACGTMGKINVFKRNTSVDVPVNRPTPMNLGNVEWKVLNIDEMKALAKQHENDPNAVFYVLDKGNYEVLSMNLAEMDRYIRDQSAENGQLREAIGINTGEKK